LRALEVQTNSNSCYPLTGKCPQHEVGSRVEGENHLWVLSEIRIESLRRRRRMKKRRMKKRRKTRT